MRTHSLFSVPPKRATVDLGTLPVLRSQACTHPTRILSDTLRTLMQARPPLQISLLLLEVAANDGPLVDLREKLRRRYQRMEDEMHAAGWAGFRFKSTTQQDAAKIMPQFQFVLA